MFEPSFIHYFKPPGSRLRPQMALAGYREALYAESCAPSTDSKLQPLWCNVRTALPSIAHSIHPTVEVRA